MRRSTWLAGAAATALGVLAWPGPAASADTSLGGYTADAQASVVHLELYEPVIPIPSEPQGDFSLGYTHSQVSSGPSTRATASYLWPGTVIGDGFDQLTGKPGATYPVQTNSRYPATSDAPAKNAVQITDGNGMETQTDGYHTKAHVAGLGIAGPNTNLLGGLGKGLGSLSGKKTKTPKSPDVPVPVSGTLAELVTADNMTSTTDVVVADKLVTTTATAAASTISILHGLLDIDGFSVTTAITSDGKKATSTGTVHIGSLSIAGTQLGLGNKGALVGKGQSVKLPKLPASATAALTKLGVTLTVTPVAKKVDGATGTYDAQGLVVTIDTATLKGALNGPLNAIVTLLGPKAATQLAPLLQLQPKLVINIGDISASTSASPAYVAPPPGGGTTPPPTGGGTTPTTGSGGTVGSTGFGGGSTGGGGFTGGGTGTGTTGGSTGNTGTSGGTPATPVAQAGFTLPPLGTVPKVLVLVGLVIAGAIGWVLQTAGGTLLGGAAPCRFGLSKGVPNLRKG